MKAGKFNFEHYKEMVVLAEQLGLKPFEGTGSNSEYKFQFYTWYNGATQLRTVDLSATGLTLESIAYCMGKSLYEQGKEDKAKEIKLMLGIV
jgi:hypothetical protein